ncbi:MAG: DUF115 domain-containing protein [Spirochaetes bacterium]|nr:DUF115 domain-containing protein [Spirochaetota bacterium]
MKEKIKILKEYKPYLNISSETISSENIIIEKTKQGPPTLKYYKGKNAIYLHSRYDPLKEAGNIVNQFKANQDDIIVILGTGLGYHIKKIRERFTDNYLVVCEYGKDIFLSYIRETDTDLLKDDQIIYFLSSFHYEDIAEALRYLIFIKLQKEVKVRIFSHTPSFHIYPEYRDLETDLLKEIGRIYSDYLTVREMDDLWKRNVEKNKKNYSNSQPLKKLHSAFKGKPLSIVCAGPTLERDIRFLKKNKTIILSVDTACRFLIKNKIYPDFVISLDAKYENIYDFKYLDFKNTNLIYDLVAFPEIPGLFKNKYVTYTLKLFKDLEGRHIPYRSEPVREFIKQYGDMGGLQSGGSVATNAFDLALFTEADPIYFLGLDLVHVDYRSHCRGTLSEIYFNQRTNRFYNLATLEFYHIMGRKISSSLKQGHIITEEFMMKKYKSWFIQGFQLVKNKVKVKVLSEFF